MRSTRVHNPPDRALARAIKRAGGHTALAARLGISAQAVWKWCRVPAERVLAVEAATNGEVTRHDLRPDLYPDEAVPAAVPVPARLSA